VFQIFVSFINLLKDQNSGTLTMISLCKIDMHIDWYYHWYVYSKLYWDKSILQVFRTTLHSGCLVVAECAAQLRPSDRRQQDKVWSESLEYKVCHDIDYRFIIDSYL
jgi:hypothetical protein